MLFTKRFGPLFVTQFFGAFNDNLFKTCLGILIAYKLTPEEVSNPELLVTLSAGIFILPFLLFSSGAGIIADNNEKSGLVRKIKILEIILMVLGAVGFLLESVPVLMAVLFAMGTQSTLFGPLKYSLLPLLLRDGELVKGNGLISSATFIAIIAGTIFGALYRFGEYGDKILTGAIVLCAIAGWVASLFIPVTPPEKSAEKKSFFYTWVGSFFETAALLKSGPTIKWTILIVSCFWFFGASVLSQLVSFTKFVANADETVYVIFLVAFTLGISTGAGFCSVMIKQPTIRWVVSSAGFVLGMAILVFLIPVILPQPENGTLLTFTDFGSSMFLLLYSLAFFMQAAAGAVFVIPVFALMQKIGEKNQKARIIGANNIYNSLFMVLSAVFIAILYIFEIPPDAVLLIVGTIFFLFGVFSSLFTKNIQ